MDDDQAKPLSAQLRILDFVVYTTAIALVLGIQIALAKSLDPEGYKNWITHAKPQMVVLTVVDALAKAFAICGLFALVSSRGKSASPTKSPSGYLWALLGTLVVCGMFALVWIKVHYLVFLLHIAGGIAGACWAKDKHWKILFTTFAMLPFLSAILYAVAPMRTGRASAAQMVPALVNIVMTCLLLNCARVSRVTLTTVGVVVTQIGLTLVSVLIFLLFYFDLWQ